MEEDEALLSTSDGIEPETLSIASVYRDAADSTRRDAQRFESLVCSARGLAAPTASAHRLLGRRCSALFNLRATEKLQRVDGRADVALGRVDDQLDRVFWRPLGGNWYGQGQDAI